MSRQYKHKTDGYRVPSVTTIIPDGYEGAPEDLMQEAKARGTFVHQASVLLDADNLNWDSVPLSFRPFLEGWALAVEELSLHHIGHWTERPSLSKVHGFAGTADRVSYVGYKTTPTVIDIKTGDSKSSKMLALWGLQLAGYEILYREVEDFTAKVSRMVVQVHSTGKFTSYPLTDATDIPAFKSFCNVLKWKMAKGLA